MDEKVSAKNLVLKVVPSSIANPFIRKHHYSGKCVNNSSLHFGVFWEGKLEGVMSYGPPLDKSKVIGLVQGTGWNQMLELNRMAFSDVLPRNSESRAISQSMKLIKRNAPHIKWILEAAKAEVLTGYQLRYIYFIDKRWRGRLTVPAIPFSKIDEVGAGMYKGRHINVSDRK